MEEKEGDVVNKARLQTDVCGVKCERVHYSYEQTV
jgi:hypothetical protein